MKSEDFLIISSLSSLFLSSLSFLWIGAQFPQEKFLSYGRILTLHYYFLLMCILMSLGFNPEVICLEYRSFRFRELLLQHKVAKKRGKKLQLDVYNASNFLDSSFFSFAGVVIISL